MESNFGTVTILFVVASLMLCFLFLRNKPMKQYNVFCPISVAPVLIINYSALFSFAASSIVLLWFLILTSRSFRPKSDS